MSTWQEFNNQSTTGLRNTTEHHVGGDLQNTNNYCDWDSINIDKPDRSGGFVAIGSIRYGVRLGAVSPPPPAAHYRATVGFLHQKRYENQKFPDECYCDVVNLPWSRSITSASQIPFLVDEPQPSINNYSIFKPVNSVDTPNSYYTASTSSTSLQNIDDKKTKLPSTTDDNDCDYLKTLQQIQQYNPKELRRKVIVRSQSDTAASFNKNYNRDNTNQCTNTLPKQREQTRYDNLERLNKFRFGGNRTNNKDTSDTSSGTKTFYNKSKKPTLQTSEEKAERLRELTDRWKKATSKKYQNIEDGRQYGPVPPPRTRHSGSHHQYTTTHTKPYYQDHSKYDPHYHPSRSAHYQRPPMKTTEEESTETTPPPLTISHTKTNSDSKTITSNVQRTVPYRSMSFSHVDYSPQDGKYVRRRKNESEDALGGILTIPRKRNIHDITRPIEPDPEKILNDPDDEVTKILQNINISDEFNLLKPSNFPDVCDIKNEFLPVNQRVTEEIPDAPGESTEHTSEDKKRDRSKRRKGMYISQWPDQRDPDDNETVTPPLLNETDDYFDLSKKCSVVPDLKNIDPAEIDDLPKLVQYSRTDSLSETELEQLERRSITPNRENAQTTNQSELSDSEIRNSVGSPRPPRRYSKRPIRGPYGQMLEAEMNKPTENKNYRNKNQKNDLKFLDDYTPNERSISPKIISVSSNNSIDNTDDFRTKQESNRSLDSTLTKNNLINSSKMNNSPRKTNHNEISTSAPTSVLNESDIEENRLFTHHRTTSSPSKLEAIPVNERTTNITPSSELLHELLRGSSERLTVASLSDSNPTIGIDSIIQVDTRTHIVIELYETERSYVESLHIIVLKYLEPLKSPENSGLLDAALVDEIFYQIPDLLTHHQGFLEDLNHRLEHWSPKQKIGDLLLDFTKPAVVDIYTAFINNWKRAKEVIKTTSQAKPAFARFLEAMAREHKGKLALDSLLIKPVQKFPKYELLIQRLIKHTDPSHPDYHLLLEAQKEIHENLIKINCTERETVEFEQQQQHLKDLESLVEGLGNLVSADRIYLRHDLVTMSAGQGGRKERGLFLFSDLLIVTSIKRRSGTIRKTSGNFSSSVTSTLDANKYKLLMRIPLEDLEIIKTKDENVRRMMLEIENLQEDISVLNQITELTYQLHCTHNQLEDLLREMLSSLNRQLTEHQSSDSQLSYLELTLNTTNGIENLSIVFSQPDKKASWEECFNEAKHKLAMVVDRRPSPEFLMSVPIRKTRAGLQFTCASPTLTCTSNTSQDVWVCNSDGYVGQVCILSLHPEPTVTSCNGVCNARILCIASIPAGISNSSSSEDEDSEKNDNTNEQTRKSMAAKSKSPETTSTDSSDDNDNLQPTMWLGTEDGCIHVYNCNDNIRIKKNKIKLQHCSSIQCIIYLDNRVFVSLANGDITIYSRDQGGSWNISSPLTVSVGTSLMPVNKMLPNNGKLWCGCNITIKIFNIQSLTVEHTFQINGDQNKPISCMVLSGLGVWLSLQNSAIIKCFHSITYEFLCEVNVAPSVTKMLTSCDDIIRQHKAACLRVTAILACKDLLWIGTSAGVLLTMSLPHITASTSKISLLSSVIGVPHGHTGHVRFLTCVETVGATTKNQTYSTVSDNTKKSSKLLIISGGDGYEDFRSSNVSEVAGREDSTNHLLLWHV